MDFLYLCYGKKIWKSRFQSQQKNPEGACAIIQVLGRTLTVQTEHLLYFLKNFKLFITVSVTPCFQKFTYESFK